MIIVQSVGKKQTLARDENAKWYRVNKTDIKVGDEVSENYCVALSDRLCRIYEKAIKLIAICKENPDIY
jgi:hypothetical protein